MKNIQAVILMGSENDWSTMKKAAEIFEEMDVTYEAKVISAHRTPELLVEFLKEREANGLKVVIAGAGVAAHLAGVCAAHTVLPVLGVPIDAGSLKGLDALLATVQMPPGIPVATFAIGAAGAKNAALCAVSILGTTDDKYLKKIKDFRAIQADRIKKTKLSL